MCNILNRIDMVLEKICSWLLVISLVAMLFFTLFGIFLRWFNSGFLWIDPLVRHLVFLATFLGGAIATGRGSHIGIDIVGRLLEARNYHYAKLWVTRVICIISVSTLIWLVYASLHMVQVEWEFGRAHFLKIHSAFLVGIIPFGFSLIAYRFLNRFVQSFVGKEQSNV